MKRIFWTLVLVGALASPAAAEARRGNRGGSERRGGKEEGRSAPERRTDVRPNWGAQSRQLSERKPVVDRPLASERAGGIVKSWTTEYRKVEPSIFYPTGEKPKEYPLQQNSKTLSGENKGEHRFYDPRTGKEGAKFGQSNPADRKGTGGPERLQFRLRPPR